MLNPCSCGGAPVEQTRGQMKPEDHHAQYRRIAPAKEIRRNFGILLDVEDLERDAFNVEDQGEEHATDVRVSCPSCGKATGWDRRDIEQIRDVGGAASPGHAIRVPKELNGNIENIRKRWNNANPVK